MKDYNFIFGYESPVEYETNKKDGTDFESSALVIIRASSETEALAWGEEIAERFLRDLYQDSSISWRQRGYASFIATDLSDREKENAPRLAVGEYLDMTKFLKYKS